MKLELEAKLTTESIREYSYRMLKKNIINFNLKPGDIVSEATVGEVFHASRTPIRETFARLAADGLLEIRPQKSSTISLIDEKRVFESLFMRRVQEEAMIVVACQNCQEETLFKLESNLNQQKFFYEKKRFADLLKLDNEMHELFFYGCEMEHIWMAMQSISADQYRIRHLRLESISGWQRAIGEHEHLILCIKNGNGDEARQIIHKHIIRINDGVKNCKKEYPKYFK